MKRVWISCVGANCVRPQGLRKFAAGRRVVAPYKMEFPFERNCKVYLQSKFTICSASHAAEKETVFREIDLFFRKTRREGDAVCRYSEPHATPFSVSTHSQSRGIVKFTCKVNLRFAPRLTRRKKKLFFCEIDLFFRKARREGDAVCRYSEPHATPYCGKRNYFAASSARASLIFSTNRLPVSVIFL